MELRVWIVLAAVVASLFLPLSFSPAPLDDGRAFLVTLDVCHADGPALSLNADLPAVHADALPDLFLALAGYLEPAEGLRMPVVFAALDFPPPVFIS